MALGPIRVQVEGLGTLEFPEGTDPTVIDRTVKREVASRRSKTIDLQPSDDGRSVFAKAVDVATTPLVPQIGRAASRVADVIDTAPNPTSGKGGLLSALKAIPDVARNFATGYPAETLRGLEAGAVEGVGNVLSQFTSPLDAALTATGLRSLRSAAPLISRGVDVAGNTALALRGAERAIDPESSADVPTGLLQAALGAAGAKVSAGRPRVTAGQPRPEAASPGDAAKNTGGAPDITGLRRVVSVRRRELQNDMQAREAAVDPARINDIRVRAQTGEILDRPTVAGPRVVQGLARRTTMTPEAPQTIEPGQARPIDQLPGVTRGPRLTPEDAGFLRWLADDLRENTFQQGGLSKGQLNQMNSEQEGMRFVAAGHVAGTPTQKTFNELGIDATRPEIRHAIENLLEGKGGDSPIHQAALKYVAAMREAWTGDKFDWSRVTDETLQQIGLRSRKQLQSPQLFPEVVFEGQGPETREHFAPATRTEADGLIPDKATVIEGLRRRHPSEDVRQPQPIDDPLANVEPFVQRLPEVLRPGVRQILADNQGFADQRRQSMPFGVTDRLARQLSVDVSQTLPKGTALNAESLRAYANAVATTGQKVKTLTDKMNAAQATDADLVALEAARAEHATVLASMMGARAEAGRALSSFRMYAKVLESGDSNLIRAALKAPGVRSGAQELAQRLAAAGDDALAQYAVLRDAAQPTFGDKFRQYYYANILSGLKTHERNALGNFANALTNMAMVPATAAVDLARSRLTTQPRTAYLGELPPQLFGAMMGAQRGFKDFVFTLKNGISPRGLEGTLDAARSSGTFDLPRVELRGGGRNPFNWPGRMLEGTDAFFRSVAKSQEWYGLAYTQARREGLTSSQQIADRIAALKAEDSPLAQQLDQQAAAFAQRAVFQEEPGHVAQWLQRGSQKFPPLAFVIPFVKTPANILRQGMEFSPAGALMKAARQEGRAGTQAQARVAMGTALLAPLAWLAATGRISGSGPQDPAERAAKMEAGWRPNAIKLRLSPAIAQQLSRVGGLEPATDGEYWVSYSLFQPASVPASVVANAFEAWQAQDGKNAPSVTAIATMVMRTARSVLDQSYLSGLYDFLEAVDNPDQWASRYLARAVHSLTPFAGAQRTAQQALDPTVRQPKGFTESLQAQVPGLSQNVPPRLDRFGEEVTRPGNAIARAADPFNVSPVVSTPVAKELERLGIDVSLPNGRIAMESGRVLSRDEEQRVRQTRGRAVMQGLQRLLTTPMYADLADEAKRRYILRVIERSRGTATRQLRQELREP